MKNARGHLVALDPASIAGRFFLDGDHDYTIKQGALTAPVLFCTEVMVDVSFASLVRKSVHTGKEESVYVPCTAIAFIRDIGKKDGIPMSFLPAKRTQIQGGVAGNGKPAKAKIKGGGGNAAGNG